MSQDEIAKNINGKVVLITGGTGSFGNAMVERLLKLEPKQIIVFSRDEKKQFDMANKFTDSRLRFVLGDVRDHETVNYIMKGVDLVFHAAALKQVPNCEFFPMEAIKTNAIGAYNVIQAAMHHNIERVVVLSTDKAVHPINVMGMTKALMERIMIAASRDKKGKTIVCGTRYGNVMYTRGSVLPYLVERIKNNKTITVTNGKMTRFMMPLSQATDLVLFALANGKDGEIYVRKAFASKMEDVASALASIFKYDKKIEEIGTRPGEKTHETLISKEEVPRTKDAGDYYVISPEVPNMDMKEYFFNGKKATDLHDKDGYTSANTKCLSLEETKELLLSLEEIQNELKSLGK
jgi:UDP-glucose 4-epimerase